MKTAASAQRLGGRRQVLGGWCVKREQAQQLAAQFHNIPGCFSAVDAVGRTYVVVIFAYFPTEFDQLLRCLSSVRQAEALLETLQALAL